MTEKLELYKCDTCGNIVQVIINGEGTLVCCDLDMMLLKPNKKEDEMLNEKHVPVFIDIEGDKEDIKVGAVPHPMVDEHYIMFIEAISKDKDHMKLKYLHPGDEPHMIHKKSGEIYALDYCNIHGLWEGQRD